MLIPEYKSILGHIPKTAGQSIENYLLNKRKKNRPSDGKNHLLCPNNDPKNGPQRLAHLTATDYVKFAYISEREFKEYFKFSIIRNPWARVVSFYKFRGFNNLVSFNHFVNRYLPEYFEKEYWFFRPQTDFIFDDNENLVVDFVGRFESLDKDFNSIAEKMNIPFSKLPFDNVSEGKKIISRKSFNLIKKHPEALSHLNFMNTENKDYKELYNSTSKEIVEKLYERDMDLLKYKY